MMAPSSGFHDSFFILFQAWHYGEQIRGVCLVVSEIQSSDVFIRAQVDSSSST
jgi:hypothetical protein